MILFMVMINLSINLQLLEDLIIIIILLSYH